MRVLTIESLEELEDYLGTIDRPMLYRGQTKHFGGTESPAVISTFDRLGCVPDLMIRWSYYAHGALKYVLGEPVHSLATTQAILQHYGWRSFFLDASSSPNVSAWFAAYSYKDQTSVHLCEDCFEDPMLLRKPGAAYELEKGVGHLYVIDVEATRALGIGLHDLSSLNLPNGRPRFRTQSAWLLGPHRGPIPIECFHSRIIADRAIFAKFAAKGGFTETLDLFPPPQEDAVLDSLLHLPWMELELPEDGREPILPAFRRTVEIPEYHDGFIKIHSPAHAFYRRQMLAEMDRGKMGQPPYVFRRVPPIVMLGTADPVGTHFPHVAQALDVDPCIAFEVDELVRLADTGPSCTYGKGLVIRRKEGGLIEVGELLVDHPGMQIAAEAASAGWHYSIDADGEWSRTRHAEDCPCGDDDRHLRHVSALTILEAWLTNPADFSE